MPVGRLFNAEGAKVTQRAQRRPIVFPLAPAYLCALCVLKRRRASLSAARDRSPRPVRAKCLPPWRCPPRWRRRRRGRRRRSRAGGRASAPMPGPPAGCRRPAPGRGARMPVMAKRCASSRDLRNQHQGGRIATQRNLLAAVGEHQFLQAHLAALALFHADDHGQVQPQLGEHLARHAHLAALCAIDQHQVRQALAPPPPPALGCRVGADSGAGAAATGSSASGVASGASRPASASRA